MPSKEEMEKCDDLGYWTKDAPKLKEDGGFYKHMKPYQMKKFKAGAKILGGKK
jgi:hypothetical protein